MYELITRDLSQLLIRQQFRTKICLLINSSPVTVSIITRYYSLYHTRLLSNFQPFFFHRSIVEFDYDNHARISTAMRLIVQISRSLTIKFQYSIDAEFSAYRINLYFTLSRINRKRLMPVARVLYEETPTSVFRVSRSVLERIKFRPENTK